MKKFFKNLWARLNGNKTIIGTWLLYLLSRPWAGDHLSPEAIQILTWTVATFTGASAVHHIAKGYLGTEKQ